MFIIFSKLKEREKAGLLVGVLLLVLGVITPIFLFPSLTQTGKMEPAPSSYVLPSAESGVQQGGSLVGVDLGTLVETHTEVVFVSRKRVVKTNDGRGLLFSQQLHYVWDLLTVEGGVLTLFVDGSSFDGLEVGDRLKLHYNLYEQGGSIVPLIVGYEVLSTD